MTMLRIWMTTMTTMIINLILEQPQQQLVMPRTSKARSHQVTSNRALHVEFLPQLRQRRHSRFSSPPKEQEQIPAPIPNLHILIFKEPSLPVAAGPVTEVTLPLPNPIHLPPHQKLQPVPYPIAKPEVEAAAEVERDAIVVPSVAPPSPFVAILKKIPSIVPVVLDGSLPIPRPLKLLRPLVTARKMDPPTKNSLPRTDPTSKRRPGTAIAAMNQKY
mmetsp:Transcript_23130/g.37594  ORF Transcript_23130/g.37594 Transcript_23130/m.37594 type:complete len:217 (+) Transcript_23130:1455-2105(+)